MQNNKNAIEIENISKRYRLGLVSSGTLSHDLNRWWHRVRGKEDPYLKIGAQNERDKKGNSEYIWALRDINLEVKEAEVLGIIGKNGAGKSTLLKILSRVTGSTTGSIRHRGRIGALLEIGTGFHPELTGRENIFINGAILGMTKDEINRKLDEIIDFSGCARSIDTPVKRYSSGMMVRLGFAVAAHLEPEILVVDEVLAVGDAEFQKKALGKMQDVSRKEGRTVLFVSHNMAAVQTLCTSVISLEQGIIGQRGSATDVVSEYLKRIGSENIIPISERTDRQGAGEFKFDSLTILDDRGEVRDFVMTGENIYFRIGFKTPPSRTKMSVPLEITIRIRDHQGTIITSLSSFFTDESPIGIENVHEVTCFVPNFPLLEGQYLFDLWCSTSRQDQDWIENAMSLRVEAGNYYQSSHTWRPNPNRHGSLVIPQKWYDQKFVGVK